MGERRLRPKEVPELAVNEHTSTDFVECRPVRRGVAREGRGANGEKGQFRVWVCRWSEEVTEVVEVGCIVLVIVAADRA